MQEDGATSSTDVAETVTASTEVLRSAEPDHCVLLVRTHRQRDTVEFTHSLLGEDALHRRRQDSDLEDASSDRTDIAEDTGMDKVLVNHHKGSVAVTGPKEVTVHTVRVGCERFEMWKFGVCSLRCQNETAEITLLDETSQDDYSFPRRGKQTTNATATDILHGRLHNAQSTLRSKRHCTSG